MANMIAGVRKTTVAGLETVRAQRLDPISEEQPEDAIAIEALYDATFGPARHGLTAYRFRVGIPAAPGLSFVMRSGEDLVGTVRFWPALFETEGRREPVLLLGPLAVLPSLKGTGIGTALLRHGLDACRARAERAVFLVGDLPYYGRVGFGRVLPSECIMPGPVDPARVLVWSGDPSFSLPQRFSLLPLGTDRSTEAHSAATRS